MKTQRIRLALSALVVVAAAAFALYNVKDYFSDSESLDSRLRQLQSRDASTRRSAAAELARFSNDADRVVPALVAALTDSDREVRLSVLESLGTFDGKAAPCSPVVRQLAKQGDGEIRAQAVALLGKIKDRESVPVLTEVLDDPEAGVRTEAARGLGQLGRGISTKPLIEKLRALLDVNQPEGLRLAALGALDSLARNEEQVARVIADAAARDTSLEVRKNAVNMLFPGFDFAMPTLIAALDDPEPQVRLAAGTKLAMVGLSDDRTVPALCRAAVKADPLTREGFGMIIHDLSLEPRKEFSPREQPDPAHLTRRYLAAVGELRHVLETPGAAARREIITVLARLIANYEKLEKPGMLEPSRAALDGLLGRIADEKEGFDLRLHAIAQWSMVAPAVWMRYGHRKSDAPGAGGSTPEGELHALSRWVVAMGALLTSPTAAIHSRAVEILSKSLDDAPADPHFVATWEKLVPIVADRVRSDDPKLRQLCLGLLTRLGPLAAGSLPSLRAIAREAGEGQDRSAVEEAIRSVSSVEGLKAPAPAARIAACKALAGAGWRATRAIPALVSSLKDPDAKVRIAAVRALESLGSPEGPAAAGLGDAPTAEADPPVRAAMVNALETIAPGSRVALEAHLKTLRDPDADVRVAAATFREMPADESLAAALISALGDPNESVRRAAATALCRIMFSNPLVVPALVKALDDGIRRPAVEAALLEHLEKVSERAEFGRVRGDLPKLRTALDAAIPAIRVALGRGVKENTVLLSRLLGRILGFANLSRDEGLLSSIEPALAPYLGGLTSGDPESRSEVLGRLGEISIRRAEVISLLVREIEQGNLPEADYRAAVGGLQAQTAAADSDPGVLAAFRPAIPLLMKALESPRTDIRQAAISAPGMLGKEAVAAEPALERLAASDSQAEIRKEAGEAVKAVRGLTRMPRPRPRSTGGMTRLSL